MAANNAIESATQFDEELAEYGDSMSLFAHPAFQLVSFWVKNGVVAFQSGSEVANVA